MQDIQTLTAMALRIALEEVYTSLPDNADHEIIGALSWDEEPNGCVLCKKYADEKPDDVLRFVLHIQDTILNALIKAHSLGQKSVKSFGIWTDAKELPPDGDYSVLVAFSNGGVEDMKMAHVQDWTRGYLVPDIYVTHWMRMPTHPKESENAN